VPLQHADLPAACRQAGGLAQPASPAPITRARRSPVSGGRANQGLSAAERTSGPAEELAAQDFPLVPDAGVRFILKPAALSSRRTQPVLVKVLMVEPGRQACQFGEQFGGPHVGVFRRGEAVEKPGVDLRVELRQLLQASPISSVRVTRPWPVSGAESPDGSPRTAQQLIGQRFELGHRARARCRSAGSAGTFRH
jgi:hypothetical protein